MGKQVIRSIENLALFLVRSSHSKLNFAIHSNAHLSNVNLLLKLSGSGSVICENGSTITVRVPEMIINT